MAVALILAGGSGTRLGADIPKQYIEVYGRCVISYCIERLSCHEKIDRIQIVAQAQWHEKIKECLEAYDKNGKFRGFSVPGRNRQLSIYNGLSDMKEYVDNLDVVLVHDAARPLLSERMITNCLEAIRGYDGVVPVLPMKDTVYQSADGKKISALVKRSEIFSGQAPEAFRFGVYYEANRRLLPDTILTINGSTEPAVMAGLDMIMIAGDEDNFKITTKEDLERFRELIKRRNNNTGER
ncbi:2-C-methyl-D-erythritol 4-phosphate cytidylyltransferase [Lachnospiraceae bacterium MD335]|nr:2-C-methyl-D-erythritol 4-phosphate cytidylyltransferase [Lachnospiraceae bacterium MD335]